MNGFRRSFRMVRILHGCLKQKVSSLRHVSHALSAANVYISTCHNIFYNLALEEWIYNNVDFSGNRRLLILWRNEPSVVIGRHQNPWVECCIHDAQLQGVHVSRRQSGGGTVYHDLGNLNCTFFTSKKNYDRKENLELVAKTLRENWDLDVSVSKRDDLILETKYKISGTAAKLARKVAYHHCTLLFDVNKDALGYALKSDLKGVNSKATESVRSAVKNLCETRPDLSYATLTAAIAKEYLDTYTTVVAQKTAEYVDPTREKHFSGIHAIYTTLQSWDWIYGKTPKFLVRRTFSSEGEIEPDHCSATTLVINLEINKGYIVDAQIELLGGAREEMEELCGAVRDLLVGQRFWPSDIACALSGCSDSFTGPQKVVYRWICHCMDQVFN